MCHYITAVLPKAAAHADLDAIARGHGRQFEALSNPGIAAQLRPDEAYFLTTTGHCDCGTQLGALIGRGTRREKDPEVEAQRLARKGWSKAKIARALDQKREHETAAAAAKVRKNSAALSDWLNFISAVLDSGMSSSLGLLLHMYEGSIASGFPLTGRQTVRQRDLSAEVLGNMREDVLYLFVR